MKKSVVTLRNVTRKIEYVPHKPHGIQGSKRTPIIPKYSPIPDKTREYNRYLQSRGEINSFDIEKINNATKKRLGYYMHWKRIKLLDEKTAGELMNSVLAMYSNFIRSMLNRIWELFLSNDSYFKKNTSEMQNIEFLQNLRAICTHLHQIRRLSVYIQQNTDYYNERIGILMKIHIGKKSLFQITKCGKNT